jgi:hypothetical protein
MSYNFEIAKNIPIKGADDNKWILWHEALKKRYGKKVANDLFLDAWDKRSDSKSNTVNLRKYLEKQGIDIDRSVWDFSADIFDETGDFFSKWFGITSTFGTVAAILITIIVLVFLYNIARNPNFIIQGIKASKPI